MRKIKAIYYDSAGNKARRICVGDEVADSTKCTEINEHKAQGEGDKWFYDIHFSDGEIVRIFNPTEVLFSKDDGVF